MRNFEQSWRVLAPARDYGQSGPATIISLTQPGSAEVGDRQALGAGAAGVVLAIFALIGLVVVLNHVVERL